MNAPNCDEFLGCSDKQGEDMSFLNVQSSINQKPKLRSLSLKRRAAKTDDQVEPNIKRTCTESEATTTCEFIAPGLKNLGNTCYINSVLQVLFHLPKFRALISSLVKDIDNLSVKGFGVSKESSFNYTKFDLVRHLNRLFHNMQSCQSGVQVVVDPSNVYGIVESLNPSFRYGEEHDAHEFLTFFLSLIREAATEVGTLSNQTNETPGADSQPIASEPSLGKASPPQVTYTDLDTNREVIPATTSSSPQVGFNVGTDSEEIVDSTIDFVSDMFHGTMERVTRCSECETESKTLESFQDLLLHTRRVKELPQRGPNFGSRGNVANEDKDLSDDEDEEAPNMFTMLRDVEKLGSANKFHCLICRHMVEAQRRISFVRCPPVLIVHVQRLPQLTSFTSCGMTVSTKVTENTKIPLELNCLEENCQSQHEHRMKLFAVVSHTGYTTSSGHYRAYINSSIKDKHDLPTFLREPNDISANSNSEHICLPNGTSQYSRNEEKHIIDPRTWIELDDDRVKWLLSEDLERITGTGYSFNTPNMLFYSRTF